MEGRVEIRLEVCRWDIQEACVLDMCCEYGSLISFMNNDAYSLKLREKGVRRFSMKEVPFSSASHSVLSHVFQKDPI